MSDVRPRGLHAIVSVEDVSEEIFDDRYVGRAAGPDDEVGAAGKLAVGGEFREWPHVGVV